ncbi:MAG: ABC transporter substrate-binding protein, partial [Acetobacteraceae bacterium]
MNGTKINGDLAEKWDVSKDGLTITFHMRPDVKFESGNPVTAADAEFSLRRVVTLNKTPGFIVTQLGYTKDNVEKLIRATDTHTLVMQLPSQQATSFVLYCLSANVGCVVDKATVMSHAQGDDLGNGWLKTHTAGAGGFKLTAWQASDHITVDANPHASPHAGVKRIVLQHVKDPAEQFLLLQKGGVDIARDLQSDQLKALAGNAQIYTESSGQATSMYIVANQNVPVLTKPEVHQAIKWAIDYEAIAKNITLHTWTVWQSFLPKGIPGALSEQPFKQDFAKAKALLAQAGVPNGFNVTMDFISAPPYDQIAQAVQADLGKVGIKVQLLPGEQKQVITKTRARTHQLAMLVWGSDYFDPNSNAQAFCADPDDSDTSKLKILAWR